MRRSTSSGGVAGHRDVPPGVVQIPVRLQLARAVPAGPEPRQGLAVTDAGDGDPLCRNISGFNDTGGDGGVTGRGGQFATGPHIIERQSDRIGQQPQRRSEATLEIVGAELFERSGRLAETHQVEQHLGRIALAHIGIFVDEQPVEAALDGQGYGLGDGGEQGADLIDIRCGRHVRHTGRVGWLPGCRSRSSRRIRLRRDRPWRPVGEEPGEFQLGAVNDGPQSAAADGPGGPLDDAQRPA